MGTYNKGILGPFSGIVGTVVGSTFRGKDVMRSRPRKSSKPATAIQLEQRAKFKKAIQFLTPARALLSDYFGSPAGSQSRFNLAVSYHIQVAATIVNNVAQLDFNKVVYAKGALLSPQNLVCTAHANAELQLNWIDNSGQAGTEPTDKLVVVCVEKDADEYQFFLNAAIRSDSTASVNLPTYLIGSAVHVYAFMVSDNGKINSTSQHLGSFEVQ